MEQKHFTKFKLTLAVSAQGVKKIETPKSVKLKKLQNESHTLRASLLNTIFVNASTKFNR